MLHECVATYFVEYLPSTVALAYHPINLWYAQFLHSRLLILSETKILYHKMTLLFLTSEQWQEQNHESKRRERKWMNVVRDPFQNPINLLPLACGGGFMNVISKELARIANASFHAGFSSLNTGQQAMKQNAALNASISFAYPIRCEFFFCFAVLVIPSQLLCHAEVTMAPTMPNHFRLTFYLKYLL